MINNELSLICNIMNEHIIHIGLYGSSRDICSILKIAHIETFFCGYHWTSHSKMLTDEGALSLNSFIIP